MATRLYFKTNTLSGSDAPTATTPLSEHYGVQSGFQTQYTDPPDYEMNETIGSSSTSRTLNTAATTSQQWGVFARFSSPPLAAQTIQQSGGTSLVFAFGAVEANGQANAQIGCDIYVYRPSTQSKVGSVLSVFSGMIDYRGDATFEVESTAPGTIKPSAPNGYDTVTTQAGDLLVCEVFYLAFQGKASIYSVTGYWGGTQVVTGTATADNPDVASYIEFGNQTLQFAGGTTPVSSDSDLRWSTLQNIDRASDLRWDSAVEVQSSLDVDWFIAGAGVALGTVVSTTVPAAQPETITVTTSTDGLLVLISAGSPYEPMQSFQTYCTFDPSGSPVTRYPLAETTYIGVDNNANGSTYCAAFWFGKNEIPSGVTKDLTVYSNDTGFLTGLAIIAYPINTEGSGAYVRQVAIGQAAAATSVTSTFELVTIADTLVASASSHGDSNSWNTVPLAVTDLNYAQGILGTNTFGACHSLNQAGITSLTWADDASHARLSSIAIEIAITGGIFGESVATVESLSNLTGDLNDLAEADPYSPDGLWIEG